MTEQELREHLKAKMNEVTLDNLREWASEALAEVGKMSGMDGYGGICVAIGAIAAAAARAADRSPMGGITGFQAGAIFWEFQKQWGVFGDGPLRMMTYDDMLYPQYNDKFATTISAETWKYLQEQAAKLLNKSEGHPAVRAHWQSIVDGTVPFDYTVSNDD